MIHRKPFLITPLLPVLSKPFQLHCEPPKQYAALYELAQQKPDEVLKKLETVKDPENANLKAYALLKMKNLAEAEKVIEDNFAKYPDNISSKINYADLCLRKKRWKEIGKIFPSTDLAALYPDKTTFTISEFRGFMVVMGFYHCKLWKYSLAEQFYILAVKADPLHPSVHLLENKIFSFKISRTCFNFFKRLINGSRS